MRPTFPFLRLFKNYTHSVFFMGQLAQIFSDRFQLQLSTSWQQWFNQTSREVQLPGFFRKPVELDGLCAQRPTQIWAGFMLPDSLPILGNGYGDWICARVDHEGKIYELVHWYHGGGDWVPVGNSLAEAVVHDAVDVHRPVRKQMLRGAVETTRSSSGSHSAALLQWLTITLSADRPLVTADNLGNLLQQSTANNYAGSVQRLIELGIAVDAAVCDSIEQIIQQSVPSENASLHMLSEEDCQRIIGFCQSVLERRQDLGWSFSLLGWCQQLNGDKLAGRESFFKGRLASAFSDQSVRLRLHRFEQKYGKFSIAQLASNKTTLYPEMLEDSYLAACLDSKDANLVARIQDYWLNLAQQASNQQDYASAYRFAFNAGWDLGAANMASYRKILDFLAVLAAKAGWVARAAIAKAHLDAI
ncbi:MAG: SMI1/KNR4 family protein [Pirellulales bacterium]